MKKILILVDDELIEPLFKHNFEGLFDMKFINQALFKLSDLKYEPDVIYIYNMGDEGFELYQTIDVQNQTLLLLGSTFNYPERTTDKIVYWEMDWTWSSFKEWFIKKVG